MQIKDKFYNVRLKNIKELYQSSKDWIKVFYTEVLDDYYTQGSFIEYVEEVYKIEIKDTKHLSTLIGIPEEEIEHTERGNILDISVRPCQ